MSYVFFFSHDPKKYSSTAMNERQMPWIYSNWYHAPYSNDGLKFSCVEQEMMYQKAVLFADTDVAETILVTKDPKAIKALGRQVQGFDQEFWDQHKYHIVYKACKAKFSQNPKLLEALLSTTGTLVEASPYDRVWGIGFSANNALQNKNNWGQNLLGNVLTKLRQELK